MRGSFKKLSSLFLCFILITGILTFIPKPASAIKNVWVEVLPRKVNTIATYKIHFTIEKVLHVHEWIKLMWPPDTKLPELPEDPHDRNERLKQIIESMSIGLSPCSSCQGLPILDYDEISLKFNTHIELDPSKEGYSDIVITVPDRVGIINPSKEGKYQFKIATQAEPTFVASAPYEIVESRIGVPEGIPEVTVVPPTYKVNAAYKITFNVGRGGWLPPGEGRIRIKFPNETVLSKKTGEIPVEAITINGVHPTDRPTVGQNTITILTPVEILDSGKVEVYLSERAGIINPGKPGDYKLEVSTMPADPDWVSSKPYVIEKGGALLSVNPPKVNKPAEFTFAFILEEGASISKGDRIIVKFPEGTTLPPRFDSSNVLINNEPVSNVSVSGYEVSVYSKVNINTGETIEVKFLKEAGIITPKTPGEIKLGYKLQGFSDFYYTLAVSLKESKLEISEVMVEPKNAKSAATYSIKFILGDNGALKVDDFIGVVFPEGVTIPSEINPDTIKVNDTSASKVSSSENTLKIYVSTPIPAGSEVNVIINKEAGIKNPLEKGSEYILSIFTTTEPTPVNSEPFNIVPPLPETTVSITGGKLGRDNWYIEPPIVGFTCSNPEAVIYVYWDDKINQTIIYDGSPKPLDLGQYESVLHYYAEDPFGKEEPKEVLVKVDNVPPEIVIESPSEARIMTKETPFKIIGRTTQIKTVKYGVDVLEYDKIVYINQTKVPVSDTDGSFSYDLSLTEGENKVLIRAEDIAGNYVEREYTILLDSIPPNVNITSPKEGEVILTPKLTVKGITENDAQLLINGEIVFVEEDGSFEHELSLKEVGKNTITIEAIDPTGNTTKSELNIYFGYTIILKIGDSSALINDTEKTLDVPPFIQSGRTLVPFRFIGEALGAKIGFTQDPKTKLTKTVSYELGSIRIILTINNKTADVNGRKVQLDVAPIIVKGRTFVPVRFVSENLGASVEWIAEEEKIIVKYPKI